MKVYICKDKYELGQKVAALILKKIKNANLKNESFNLGLPTGESPLTTYAQIRKDFKENSTNWKNINVINLDEYIGLKPDHKQSYYYYMNTNLYEPLKLDKKQIFIPKGVGEYLKYAQEYDAIIKKLGGIDLQLLSVGRNGHIGYNEPPADFNSLTHQENLKHSTIVANSRFFENQNQVPKSAITMGVKSIMNAKEIIFIAYGYPKTNVVKKMLQDDKISNLLPCSILKKHPNVKMFIDYAAASELKNKNNFLLDF